MNLYITRLNGIENQPKFLQCMTAEIAHWLGFREMGIYYYNANAESDGNRSVRYDGMIAGISAGDVVVFQFHTWNGLKFERGLVDRVKAYHGRAVIFIHTVEALMIRSSGFMLGETVELFNQAEVLIVPSYAMKRFLVDSGIRPDMKFVVQEMWDFTTGINFTGEPVFRKEIHCAGGFAPNMVRNWNSDVALKLYNSSMAVPNRNVTNMGTLKAEELLIALSKGGFGLEWYHDEQAYKYMKYGNSLSLSRYLAAGIPVIVPTGISCRKLIEDNHLGLVVNTPDEAVRAIEAMSEPEYRKYVQHVGQFALALRNGYYTKKCLIDSVQALFREDLGKTFLQESDIYDLDDYKFVSAVLKKSYGGKLVLSWNLEGEADGFFLYDASGRMIEETENSRQHYFLVGGREETEGFQVKAYINTPKGKMIVAKSALVQLGAGEYEKPLVSIVIPAYNAQDGIARSIDTVLAQSFPDVEIIVVDDGSTDNTPNIVDWYASNYQNVTAIHQENAGVQAARNMGIAHARGEFTGFIDSDDMIRLEVVEKMYHSVKKNHCDIAVMSAYKIDNRGYEEFMRYPLKEDAAMPVENFLRMYASEAYALPALWNKLYRTSLVKEHPLPQIVYEDEAWTPYVLSYAETVCYLNIHGYEYDRSTCSGSLVDKWAGKSRDEVLEDHKRSIIFYLEHGNPKRKELLKKLADNELAYFGRVMAYPKYEEVRKQIAELV